MKPNEQNDEATATCYECGGSHEPSGARSDCIRHWKLRAIQAENTVSVEKHFGGTLGAELRQWLNSQDIHGDSIGSIRRQCFMPWDSAWNALVRDETAEREKSPNEQTDDDYRKQNESLDEAADSLATIVVCLLILAVFAVGGVILWLLS